jgi:small subunit ribosomal protein S8
MVRSMLDLLKVEGFIEGYSEQMTNRVDVLKPYKEYEVLLKYIGAGQPVISLAERVSRPGRRVYMKSGELPQIHRGLGIAIISTSQGLLPDRLARKQKVGGEVVAYIG